MPAEAGAQGDERREGGRRRRGRRGRGGGGGERPAGAPEAVASGDETGAATEPMPSSPPVESVGTVPVDVEAIPLQLPPAAQALSATAPPVPRPSAPAAGPTEAIAEPAARAEPVAKGPAAAPARPRNLPDIPPITLALPLESGLELVQTTARAPEAEDAPAPEPRPKRVRPPRVVAPEEPLQIVETRRGDGTPTQA